MGFRLDFLAGQLSENMAYGHQMVFARYCRTDKEKLRIFGRYQHGFSHLPYFPDSRIKGLVWSNYMKIACEEIGLSNIWSIGSPLIYHQIQTTLEGVSHTTDKYSLCVAPHSSFDSKRSIFEYENFIQYFPNFKGSDSLDYFAKLCLAQSSFRPIALLYFNDFNEEIKARFANYGINAITLGDGIFNREIQKNFFDKQFNLIRNSEEVLVCDTNSIWAYAGLLRKSIEVFKESIFNHNFNTVKSIYGNYDIRSIELFEGINGVRDFKSPEELLEIFGSSSYMSILNSQLKFILQSARRVLVYEGVHNS